MCLSTDIKKEDYKKIRILYIINAFSWGGAEKLVYDLALNSIADVDYIGIVALYRRDDNTEAEMQEALRELGVQTMILGKNAGSGRIKGIFDIYKFAKKNKVNVIHGHCSIPMLFGKIVGLILQMPVVCTIHNTVGYSKAKEQLTSWMVKKYISIGSSAETYMIDDLRINPKNIVRIYNAIDSDKFINRSKDGKFWEQYGFTTNDKIILNVARVSEQKNQLCLVKAINHCVKNGNNNIKLCIVGYYDEQDSVYKSIKNYIIDERLEEYVFFLGMKKNVNDFLANADCFVMTSWYEGLSVAFLEAVISGINIITTDMPFVKELNAISECATIIPQNDDLELANVLCGNEFRRQNKGTIECFRELFSVNEFVEKHLELYRTVL